MRRLIGRCCRWILHMIGEPGPGCPYCHVHDDVLQRAVSLTQLYERQYGAGFGEAKRHQVYARLMKEFPTIKRRTLSVAIERALA